MEQEIKIRRQIKLPGCHNMRYCPQIITLPKAALLEYLHEAFFCGRNRCFSSCCIYIYVCVCIYIYMYGNFEISFSQGESSAFSDQLEIPSLGQSRLS